jgi:chromosomal replication initiator protein
VIPQARSAQATSVEEVQQRVAERFGISRAELVGTSRAATPLRARQVAIYLTRELTDLSLPQIGRLYGGRDHSTVLNSLRRLEARLNEDEDLSRRVDELRTAIHNPAA